MKTYYIAVQYDYSKKYLLTEPFKLKEEVLAYMIENYPKGTLFTIEQVYEID